MVAGLRSARARVNGLVARTSRLTARWTTILVVGSVWATGVAFVAVVAPPGTGAAPALATMGLVLVSALHSHRQRGVILREVRVRSRPGCAQPAPTATGAVEEILDRLKLTALSIGRLSEDLATSTEHARSVAAEMARASRGSEALQNLYAMVAVAGRMPSAYLRGGSPDLALRVVELVRTRRPRLVVECGAGAATLWCALALRQFRVAGRVVALEHDARTAGELTELLAAHDLGQFGEVRHAAVEPVDLAGRTSLWYARQVWADLDGVDLLSIHGPSTDGGHSARSVALHLLAGRLADDAVILLGRPADVALDHGADAVAGPAVP